MSKVLVVEKARRVKGDCWSCAVYGSMRIEVVLFRSVPLRLTMLTPYSPVRVEEGIHLTAQRCTSTDP